MPNVSGLLPLALILSEADWPELTVRSVGCVVMTGGGSWLVGGRDCDRRCLRVGRAGRICETHQKLVVVVRGGVLYDARVAPSIGWAVVPLSPTYH